MGKELIVSYAARGRTANNLFQYFATQVLLKMLNDVSQKHKIGITYVYKYKNEIRPYQPWLESTPEGWFEVTDEKFLDFYEKLKKEEYPTEILNKNLWFFGYYQFDQFLRENIEYVRSLFTSESSHIINDSIAMNNFAHQVKIQPFNEKQENILYTHIRLSDFIQNGHDNNIIHHESYYNLLKKIVEEDKKINTIVIVMEKITREYEGIYLQNLLKDLVKLEGVQIMFSSGSIFQDFATLYNAKKLVLSNSTYAWFAAILSEKNEVNWLPDTLNYYSNQIFNKINDQTIQYSIKYWR